MMNSSCELLEIDTKDICLLCLEPRIRTDCIELRPTVSLPSLQGLKHLLRYLKVSPKELFNCSSEFLQSMEVREDIDLKISLCSKCSSVTTKFNKLYQAYELIQIQFGNCVQSLHESMSNGNENPELVRKYMDQMRPTKFADLVHASIAANLRNETLKKCSLELESRTPMPSVGVAIPTQDPENPTAEQPSTSELPKPVDVEDCSVSCNTIRTKLPEPEENVTRETRSHKNALKPRLDNEVENKLTNEPTPISILLRERLRRKFRLMATKGASDIQIINEVKRGKANMNGKKSYFNSIRKNLRSQSQPTATSARVTPIDIKGRSGSSKVQICEYCKKRFSTRQALCGHRTTMHFEHFISTLLPSRVSLKLCKQGVHSVWKGMLQEAGNKCQFCLKVPKKGGLKLHIMGSHADQFAIKVFENIKSFPESMQDAIQADAGNSSATANSSKEESKITSTKKASVKSRFSCKHCKSTFITEYSLQLHNWHKHPEHIIYNYFPPHIPLELCKQGTDVVLKQIFKETCESGCRCKFCAKIVQKAGIKLHVVEKHAEQIAVEAQQCIGLLPQLPGHSEDGSSNDLASSSTLANQNVDDDNPSENTNESKPVIKMEVEIGEESFIKVESNELGAHNMK